MLVTDGKSPVTVNPAVPDVLAAALFVPRKIAL
jgi:hypothetical protein